MEKAPAGSGLFYLMPALFREYCAKRKILFFEVLRDIS